MYNTLSVILLLVLGVNSSNQASVISAFDDSIDNYIDFDLDQNSIENFEDVDPLLFSPINPCIEEDAKLDVVLILIM